MGIRRVAQLTRGVEDPRHRRRAQALRVVERVRHRGSRDARFPGVIVDRHSAQPSPIARVKPFHERFQGRILGAAGKGCQGFIERSDHQAGAHGDSTWPLRRARIIAAVTVTTATDRPLGRPAGAIPFFQIFQLSIYWFGINAIWGGLNNVILQRRMDDLVGKANAGSGLALLTLLGAVTAILVQPTVGTISDYTKTRWGRRKPYIAIGAVLDVVFLIGIATSNTYLSVVAFVVLLQFSSNFAQGPFQGYVPDLVPAHQVGLASALVGLMQVLGNVAGFAIGALAIKYNQFFLGTISLGVLEVVTMLSVVIRVNEGKAPKSREGRSWLSVAQEAWGTDILRERSFLFLVASRLFVLMGGAALVQLSTFYLAQSHALNQADTGTTQLIVLALITVGSLLSVIPAAP